MIADMDDNDEDFAELRLVQLALNSRDTAATVRLYSELFGFANAGSTVAWGKMLSLQGLEPDARAVIWWLVGCQEFVQLEIFHHSVPAQSPQPDNWSPVDFGWTRFGVAIPDIEAAAACLARWGIPLISAPLDTSKGKRAAFRDPFVGVIVEIFEDSVVIPGGSRKKFHDLPPALVYLTRSVEHLDDADHFYRNILKLDILPLDTLRDDRDEAMLGIEGARRRGFVAKAGDVFIEVVQYLEPLGNFQADRKICDQGILNAAFGSYQRETVAAVIERLDQEEKGPERMLNGDILAAYVLDRDREIELIACPKLLSEHVGFWPGRDFSSAENGKNPVSLVERP